MTKGTFNCSQDSTLDWFSKNEDVTYLSLIGELTDIYVKELNDAIYSAGISFVDISDLDYYEFLDWHRQSAKTWTNFLYESIEGVVHSKKHKMYEKIEDFLCPLNKMLANSDYSKVFRIGVRSVTSLDGKVLIDFNPFDTLITPKETEIIGRFACACNKDLKYVALNKNISEIGDCAFLECDHLEKVKLPNSIKQIGEFAFRNCSIYKIKIPNLITEIKRGCFMSNWISNVKLPSSIKKIQDHAFYDNRIERLIVPEGVESIEEISFSGLYYIEFPASTVNIGDLYYAETDLWSDPWSDRWDVPYAVVAKDNPKYVSRYGNIFDKKTGRLCTKYRFRLQKKHLSISEISAAMRNSNPKTYLLKWNPSSSNFQMSFFLNTLKALHIRGEHSWFNWCITDYKQVSVGDIFYIVKIGYGQSGIVAKGFISSEPYQDKEDPNTDYVADCMPVTMLNPDSLPLLGCDILQEQIPDLNWSDENSGILLSNVQAKTIDKLWDSYISENKELLYHLASKNDQDDIYIETLYR